MRRAMALFFFAKITSYYMRNIEQMVVRHGAIRGGCRFESYCFSFVLKKGGRRMDELKIRKDGNWAKLISAFITKKLKKNGFKISIRSVEGSSGEDGLTKVHIDADVTLTEAQIIKLLLN